jgi:uncharacterized phiE125 gp8 family phage protein
MPWIQLAETKTHLNETDTANDAEIQGFINAACAAIEYIKGHINPVTFAAAVFDADECGVVILPELPVESITTVTHYLGGGNTDVVPPADRLYGVAGWTWDGSAKLTVPGWRWTVAVTYSAGYANVADVPPNYRLAALDLTQHLWERSQLNASGGRPGIDIEAETIPGIANAMPYAVRELLGLYGKTIRDEVFIA